VGYGPFPEEVVQRLRRGYVLSTIGSQDRKILRFKKRQRKWRRSKSLEEYLAYKWAYENLSKKSRRYLRFLSREIRMKVQGQRVLLTHTRPGFGKSGLRRDTPEKELRRLSREARADVIICGHSHQPFARQVDLVWFLNPGSVGHIDDGQPRASYAILEIRSGAIHVDHHLVEYELEPVAAAVHEKGVPDVVAQIVLPGRDRQAGQNG
jgi:diadenosine tetraphosphatase ApaH/serine/threonine PP2A family protein phosphatase